MNTHIYQKKKNNCEVYNICTGWDYELEAGIRTLSHILLIYY